MTPEIAELVRELEEFQTNEPGFPQIFTRAAATLRRLSERTDAGWQPIETAPKDGTEIIGLFHRRYDEVTPPTIYGPWTIAFDGKKWRSSWDGQEVVEYMDDFGTKYKGPDIEPTHWQPLPATSLEDRK